MTEQFNSSLYVDRNGLTGEMLTWVRDSDVRNRLRSILGAAGIGKSWFMENLRLYLQQEGIPFLWLSLPQSQKQLDEWLENQYTNINLLGDTTAGFEVKMETLARTLCQKKGQAVLLVDGFDEVSNATERSWLQEHLLATFLGVNCTKAIIGRRDEYLITSSTLRWIDEPIPLPSFEKTEQQTQLEKRAGTASLSLAQLGGYLTGNPYLNSLVIDKAKGTTGSLDSKAIEEIIQQYFERAGIPNEKKAHVRLTQIAIVLEPTWTAFHLERKLRIAIDHPDLAPLFRSGIVSHIPRSNRYQIDQGICHLVRASV